MINVNDFGAWKIDRWLLDVLETTQVDWVDATPAYWIYTLEV